MWNRCLGGCYQAEFANNRLRIGRVHKRLDVTPKLFMSGLRLLQEILDTEIEKWAGENGATYTEVVELKNSVNKLTVLDTQLIFDAYIDSFMREVDEVVNEVAVYASELRVQYIGTARITHDATARDPLTGLFNRRTFLEFFDHELHAARRHELSLSLAYFDLNGFKKVNDTLGHCVGDEVLVALADILENATRKVDIACRYGGDEFCILMPRTTLDGARQLCEQLCTQFRERPNRGVSLSIGLVQTGPMEFADVDSMIDAADGLMYLAKTSHRESARDEIRPA